MAVSTLPNWRRRLGEAEAVCRHYLSQRPSRGRYWLVGDVRNTPGRSMFVRLSGPNHRQGRRRQMDRRRHRRTWRSSRRHPRKRPRSTSRCRRRGPALPQPAASDRAITHGRPVRPAPPDRRSRTAALRHVQARLKAHSWKRICASRHYGFARNRMALRFHPRCYYRPDEHARPRPGRHDRRRHRPRRRITGAHRTWLDPASGDGGSARRRSTHRGGRWVTCSGTVPLRRGGDVMAAGEGIETMLSLRTRSAPMPMVAALSAAHLAPSCSPTLRRLYIARDDDPAGDGARWTA
jgi:hypothetical protein